MPASMSVWRGLEGTVLKYNSWWAVLVPSRCHDKMPDKESLNRGSVYLGSQSEATEHLGLGDLPRNGKEVEWWEHETVCRVSPPVRTVLCPLPPLYAVQDPSPWNSDAHSQGRLSVT